MRKAFFVSLAASAISGCFLIPSTYDHAECWLMREDAILAFAVPADVFYVQSRLCTNEANIPLMSSYVHSEVGNGRFAGLARVFSPLVYNADDLECALTWYFRHAHEGKRPFVFIGEGEGGLLLQEYEKQHSGELKKMGFVTSFYTEAALKGFVTAEMVKKIKEALAQVKYKSIWGREMPGCKAFGCKPTDDKPADDVKDTDAKAPPDGSHAY